MSDSDDPEAPPVDAAPASWASTPAIRRTMQGNRGRDTAPEMAVRRAAHALGLRYRVSQRPLPFLRRTADLIFTTAKVAVFVDGCYWHRCPSHYVAPRKNADFWGEKISSNVRRDRETDRILADNGWLVLRYWEHEDPQVVAEKIRLEVGRRRKAHKASR